MFSKRLVSTAMTPIGMPPSLPLPTTTLLPQPGKYLEAPGRKACNQTLWRIIESEGGCKVRSRNPRGLLWLLLVSVLHKLSLRKFIGCAQAAQSFSSCMHPKHSLKVPSSKKPVSLLPSGNEVPANTWWVSVGAGCTSAPRQAEPANM